MLDAWESGEPYEYFMGRWSRLVAKSFVKWLSPAPGLKWLDVGCGSGALSEVVMRWAEPTELIAIDQSESFVNAARDRLGGRALCKVGNALALPLENSSVNCCVSGLVLNFIPQPQTALAEMKRVTVAGGTLAVYVWDYAGTMGFLTHFWDMADKLDPEASSLHESHRFPDANDVGLRCMFEKAGLNDIETTAIEINTHFRDFDDYWKPFLGGQGPAGTYVQSLGQSKREKLQNSLRESLPIQVDGSIPMRACAWAIKAAG